MWNRIRPWVFPHWCIGCGAADVALCVNCGPQPADTVTTVAANAVVTACAPYDGVLRRAIVAMKRGERAYLDPFARLVSANVGNDATLVPLPTSHARRAARGFDQAVELARRAAILRGVPCCEVLDKRGAAQRGLGRFARLASEGRFGLRPSITLPANVVVIDDVCTTGATVADGIRTLRAAGCRILGAVVLAQAGAEPSRRGGGLAAGITPPARKQTNVKAIWNGTVIAESDATEVVEGNHYFPAQAIKREYFSPSATHTTCPWKGVASYYTLEVEGKRNPDAAWFYPTPKDAAKNITDYVAFWKGVEVTQ